MWARIEGNRVAEITNIDPVGRFHTSLVWVECPTDVQSGWMYDEPTFTAPGTPEITAEQLCKQIDQAADAARTKVAGDPLRAEEYKTAATEAKAFKDASYPATSVPRTVAAWAINGRTVQEAAESILAEAAAYTEVLYQIRETRLSAKELVRQAIAAGNILNATSLTEQAITAIQQAVAGVGNSGG